MRFCNLILAGPACAALALAGSFAPAADWITAPSYYTHDKTTGVRVAQYSPIGPFYYLQRQDYSRSGYRNYRSTIELGNSADNFHMVEQWGQPVIPYEAWRSPYRPFGAPYPAWGAPYGGLNGGFGGYGGGFGAGVGGGFGPGGNFGGQGQLTPQFNQPQQWMDGHYPTYDRNDRSPYYAPYPPRP